MINILISENMVGINSHIQTIENKGRAMEITPLVVERIVIHRVFQRDPDGNPVSPQAGTSLINLHQSAMAAFKSRVIESLGLNANAAPMSIIRQGPGDVPKLIDLLIEKDEEDFVVDSYDLAQKLTEAQYRKDTKGGILVVFSGKYGSPGRPYVCFIKADLHNTYQYKEDESGQISMDYIEKALLSPSNKLYKAAGYFCLSEDLPAVENLNDKWQVLVSDFQNQGNAQYFYESFLGFGYPETAARSTQQFYHAAHKFIRKMNVEPEVKNDYLNALNTYMKVDTSTTISSDKFAELYFETDVKDQFVEHMESAGIPTEGIAKDISEISSNLKNRRVRFRSNVSISAPAEVFQNLIDIETFDGEPDNKGEVPTWTRITVKDRIDKLE